MRSFLASIFLAICMALIVPQPAVASDRNTSPRLLRASDPQQSVSSIEANAHAAKTRLRELSRLARQRWATLDRRLKIAGDPQRGRLRKVYGTLSAPSRKMPERIARQFLEENADLFLLRKGDLSDLEEYWQRESPGGTHLRFKQLHRGFIVHGAYLSVHLDPDGRVRQVSNHYLPEIPDLKELSSRGPTLAREKALSLAWKHLGIQGKLRGEPWAGLVIYPQEERARLAWQVALPAQIPLGDWLVMLDAQTGEVLEIQDLLQRFSGKGWVFDPNPVVTLKDSSLTDQDDRREAVPEEAYVHQVILKGLDKSGYLRGSYVDTGKTPHRTRKRSRNFDCRRDNPCFEEVMAYYHIDRYQRYLQSLGFSGEKAILARPQRVNAHGKRSFFSPLEQVIHFGTEGVDDAEDADIILHEYGHALQQDQVPGFGQSHEARAIGEGFSDYLAASFFASAGFDQACLGEWDALGFSPPEFCIRRVDGKKRYPEDLTPWANIHQDGEIWSATLWKLRQILGQGVTDQLAIQANFYLEPDDGFLAAGEAILQADRILNQGANQEVIRAIFDERGLSPLPLAADAFEENDSPDEAVPIQLPFDRHRSTLHSPGDQDFYRFSLDQPTTVEVRLTYEPQIGRPNLFLLDSEGRTRLPFHGSEDSVWIMAYNLSPGSYLIQVEARDSGWIGPYRLQVIPSRLPSPDAFEENESPGEARAIELPFEERGLTIDSPTDQDFYRFFLDQAETVEVRLTFAFEAGDLDLFLLDAEGRLLQSSTSPFGDTEYIIAYNLSPGSYLIQVKAREPNSINRYGLQVDFFRLFPPDAFEKNDSPEKARQIQLPFEGRELTIDSPNDQDFYRFSLDQAGPVMISLNLPPFTGDPAFSLLDGEGNSLGYFESYPDYGQILFDLAPGTYMIKVFGRSEFASRYTLSVFVPLLSPTPDRFEENNSREKAAPIELPFVAYDLNIDVSPDDLTDFYRFSLDHTRTVEINLTFPGQLVAVELLDSLGLPRASAFPGELYSSRGRLRAPNLPPGTYFVKVSGPQHRLPNPGLSPIFYSLRVESYPPLPPDRFEENDFFEEATPIELPFKGHDLTIDSPQDVDYYCFVLDRPAKLAAHLSFPPFTWFSPTVSLFNYRRESITENLFYFPSYTLPPGKYYLQVTGGFNPSAPYWGDVVPYEITVSRVEPIEAAASSRAFRLSADRMEFGEVIIGDSLDFPLTLTNEGSMALRVSQVSADGAPFSILSLQPPFSLEPGESREIVVRFSPSSFGPQSGSLTLLSDDPDHGVATVSLSGTGKVSSAIAINEGAEYTRIPKVILSLPPPFPMRLKWAFPTMGSIGPAG